VSDEGETESATTVLIVDDEPMMLRLMRRFLELRDDIVVVGEARNGRDAVELWRQLHPDIVILDHMMPVLSGIDTARQLLTEAPGQQIVMISALASDESWVRSVDEIGVSVCVSKTDISTLPDIVSRLR
jgi:two-component system chemotaxis response regulator CheY